MDSVCHVDGYFLGYNDYTRKDNSSYSVASVSVGGVVYSFYAPNGFSAFSAIQPLSPVTVDFSVSFYNGRCSSLCLLSMRILEV